MLLSRQSIHDLCDTQTQKPRAGGRLFFFFFFWRQNLDFGEENKEWGGEGKPQDHVHWGGGKATGSCTLDTIIIYRKCSRDVHYTKAKKTLSMVVLHILVYTSFIVCLFMFWDLDICADGLDDFFEIHPSIHPFYGYVDS